MTGRLALRGDGLLLQSKFYNRRTQCYAGISMGGMHCR